MSEIVLERESHGSLKNILAGEFAVKARATRREEAWAYASE
jgi:hypothetical protein